MWDKNQEDEQEDGDPEVELDPLNFLPNGQGRSGPLEATVVVEVAKKAYETLGKSRKNYDFKVDGLVLWLTRQP